MKVAIYCRVSTLEQANEGYSIGEQERKLKAFCDVNDWKKYEVFIDAGISGGTMNRPALNKMMDNISKFDLVLVYKLDRLTRSVKDLLDMLEVFEQNNVSFRSATEVYDTSNAMGRLFVTLVGAMAEWERATIRERMMMGRMAAFDSGNFVTNPPFYYDKVDNKLVPNEHVKVFKQLVRLVKKGYSTREIATKMNNSNIKVPTITNWNKTTVSRVLRNPVARGHTKFGDMIWKNTHEPTISEEEYQEIENMLHKRTIVSVQKHTSLFRGKLECPNCGRKLHLSAQTNRQFGKAYEVRRYNCSKCTRDPKVQNISFNESEVEKEFVKYMKNITLDKFEDKTKEQKEITIDIDKVMKRRARFQEAWADGMITDDEFRQRTQETDQLIEEYEKQQDIVDNQKSITAEQIKSIQNLFERAWEHELTTDEIKAAYVRETINQIHYEFIPRRKNKNGTVNTVKITDIDLKF